MKFSHLISTIFLATTFACIFLFAGIFWFYSGADSKTLILLKDSLSTTSGFFGGITTLIAAYIASKLFNDWKVQHNKTLEKEVGWDVIIKFDEADLHLTQFRESFSLFLTKNENIFELSDEEFENLNTKLNTILTHMIEASLKVSIYFEALRKYSIVADKTYYNDTKKITIELFTSIRALQKLNATFPSSIDQIDDLVGKMYHCILLIEQEVIDSILRDLKAHK